MMDAGLSVMEFIVFWVVVLCSVVIGYQHFGGSIDGNQPPHYVAQQSRKPQILS
jgi:hypothetical protein